jgi:hypothetical protein
MLIVPERVVEALTFIGREGSLQYSENPPVVPIQKQTNPVHTRILISLSFILVLS